MPKEGDLIRGSHLGKGTGLQVHALGKKCDHGFMPRLGDLFRGSPLGEET